MVRLAQGWRSFNKRRDKRDGPKRGGRPIGRSGTVLYVLSITKWSVSLTTACWNLFPNRFVSCRDTCEPLRSHQGSHTPLRSTSSRSTDLALGRVGRLLLLQGGDAALRYTATPS